MKLEKPQNIKQKKAKDFLLEIGGGGQRLPTLPSTLLPSAPKPPSPLPSRKAVTVACSEWII